MLISPKKQGGITLISLILLLGLIGFFTLIVLKVVPLYLDNSKVVESLKSLKETPDLLNKSKSDIKAGLLKRFGMNYLDKPSDQDITITSHPGYLKVDVEYERVEPFIGNLSVLVEFHEGFEAGTK